MGRLILTMAVGALCAVLGTKLIARARESGGLPERWLGGFFALSGAAIVVLLTGAELGAASPLGRLLVIGGQATMTVALLLLVRFNWKVFRPDSPGARALAVFSSIFLVGGFLAATAVGMPQALEGNVGHLLLSGRFLVLAWACFETTLYASKMRRQLALGLADPVTANRFALWSIWTGTLSIIPMILTAMRATGYLVMPQPGEPLTESIRMVFAVLGVGMMISCVAVWLAFFPPARYESWVRRSAPVVRASAS